MNGGLKTFAVLVTHFRHMGCDTEDVMAKHELCFNAVAVITQMKFNAGEKTFDVEHNVNYFQIEKQSSVVEACPQNHWLLACDHRLLKRVDEITGCSLNLM